MSDLTEALNVVFIDTPFKIVISKPINKNETYKKITIEKKESYFQISSYTEKQVFHSNVSNSELLGYCQNLLTDRFGILNAWGQTYHFSIMISKKGKVFIDKKKCDQCNEPAHASTSHNRVKNYILKEGEIIPPLVDMGIFTKDGKVVKSMYDKYKQINRFIEIIDDSIKKKNPDHMNIIDFGCGKSYLTFVVYYYLTKVKNITVDMIGLDLKADVIKHCNEIAHKYQYDNLRFELGDINGFNCPFQVDMVLTLHACDTATDYALFNAIQWKASMIFSVPCCQHELNKQISTENFSIITRYGIISERFSALATDAIRANLLEYMGYSTQLLEFVDFEHTPKNLLIRAIKKDNSSHIIKEKVYMEVKHIMSEYSFSPSLYKLLEEAGAFK